MSKRDVTMKRENVARFGLRQSGVIKRLAENRKLSRRESRKKAGKECLITATMVELFDPSILSQ